MSNPLADDVRVLDDQQLAAAVNEAYRELFNLQFQKGTRQLQDANTLRSARRQIARLRTIQRERVLAAAVGAPLGPSAPAMAPDVSPQKRRAQAERAQREAEAAAEAEAAEAEGAAGVESSDVEPMAVGEPEPAAEPAAAAAAKETE